MKKIINVLLTSFLFCIILTACGNNLSVNKTPTTAKPTESIATPTPSPTPSPTPTPLPESYLTLSQAQNKKGYFIKHGDYFIDLLKYQNNLSSGDFIIYPIKKDSIDTEMLKFDKNIDKLVYCATDNPPPNQDIAKIIPATFYGYAPPVSLSYDSDGYRASDTSFGTAKIQTINDTPITDDMITNGPTSFFITDKDTPVKLSGYQGTKYVSATFNATASCYKIRHNLSTKKTRVSHKNFSTPEREPLSTTIELTSDGYKEIIFNEPLENGVYVFSILDYGKIKHDMIFEVQ